jgi:hypothetical protein
MFYAFEYVMGIYGLSILVTLVVWLVIVAIRWLSSESATSKSQLKPVAKGEIRRADSSRSYL